MVTSVVTTFLKRHGVFFSATFSDFLRIGRFFRLGFFSFAAVLYAILWRWIANSQTFYRVLCTEHRRECAPAYLAPGRRTLAEKGERLAAGLRRCLGRRLMEMRLHRPQLFFPADGWPSWPSSWPYWPISRSKGSQLAWGIEIRYEQTWETEKNLALGRTDAWF